MTPGILELDLHGKNTYQAKVALEAALRRENISHELHLFPHGVHGLALADLETADPMKGRVPDRHVGRWQALCAEWLKEE